MTATDTRVEQTTSDLENTVRGLLELARDLAADVNETVDLERGLVCWQIVEEVRKIVVDSSAELADRLALAMPDKRVTVMGAGTFEKHRKSTRTQWDRDDLLRAVLDTRIVDPLTGEVREESQLDKVLHVWNLGAPRVTAVRGRGLDPDDFAHVEYGALTLALVTA